MSDYLDAVAEAQKLGLLTSGGDATNPCQSPECGEVFAT